MILSSRVAISTVFFVNGFVLATWFTRIPAAATHAHATTAALGGALFGMAAGALLAFHLSSWMSIRYGSAQATTVFGLAFAVTLVLPALAFSLPVLALALALLGAGNGGMDVAMNAQGVQVERRSGRPILSSLHGFFSLGGLAGAGVGGAAAAAHTSLTVHFALVASAAAIALAVQCRFLVADTADAGDHQEATAVRSALWPPPRMLWTLGGIAFCAAIGEGAMADWTAVYLKTTLSTSAGVAALGYAAFSATMLLGRFTGDALRTRRQPRTIVGLGACLSAMGLAIGLAIPHPTAAIAGFAAVGLGLSSVAPLVFAAAAASGVLPTAQTVSLVATLGYAGFLTGPPLIGLATAATSLRTALLLVAAMSAVAGSLALTSNALATGSLPSTHLQ